MLKFNHMKVRCRIAPSPTGKLHIGTAHTALFNFLFAKHNDGDFIMRIDDSDPVRSKKEFEEDILNSLTWLGIYWDEGPYRQSERKDTYQKYIDQLLKAGKSYRCFCTKEELEEKRKLAEAAGKPYIYDQKCRNINITDGRPFVVRLTNPNKVVVFNDMVRGEISVDTTSAGDFIIARSDGSPLLNFAVVIDDIEFQITHAIRGEDFLNATPYQILIYEALGVEPPKIANLSFVYAPDHTKLSKRHGATGVSDYIEMGYLPEAMVNFLALIGWNPGTDRELFTLEELIKEFDFDKVQKGMPTFNKEKLDWFNQHYIRTTQDAELAKKIKQFSGHSESEIEKLLPLVKERMVTLKDFDELTEYFFTSSKVDINYPDTKRVLDNAIVTLEKDFDGDILEENARAFCQTNDVKVGDYFMILRLAITGRAQTPPLWNVMQILGKDETLRRLQICLPKEQKSED